MFFLVVFVGENSFYKRMLVSVLCLIPLSLESMFILRSEKKWGKMPHGHFSHTVEAAFGRKALKLKDMPETETEAASEAAAKEAEQDDKDLLKESVRDNKDEQG